VRSLLRNARLRLVERTFYLVNVITQSIEQKLLLDLQYPASREGKERIFLLVI
jgi:hypothetical protein